MQRPRRGSPAVAPRAGTTLAAVGGPFEQRRRIMIRSRRRMAALAGAASRASGPSEVRPPTPHSSGARPPALPSEALPKHIAIVMDGNGRWAKERGLHRNRGHERGEYSLFDAIEGAIELGIPYLSAYAFSTEN